MGVRGLTTFINSMPSLMDKYRLHNTKLLIDASNVYYSLYFNFHVPFELGGDYHVFAEKIRDFFETLQKCNITPYVVYDGGYEKQEKKLNTRLEQAQEKINTSCSTAQRKSSQLIPLFTEETFNFILEEMGIQFVYGDFEADNQIALLANEWKCPVLSNDSDFFIFSLEGGFIPLNKLDLTIKTMKDESTGETVNFLDCQRYHFDNLVKVFQGLDTNMLPLLSTVFGNDYVEDKSLFQNFFNYLTSIAGDCPQQTVPQNKPNALFLSFLYWLTKQSSVSEAITNITEFMKTEDHQIVTKMMHDSVNNYSNPESSFSMRDFFEKNQLEFSENGIQKFGAGNPLPEWLLKSLKIGKIPVFCLNILHVRYHILFCQVENVESESSHICSKHIRQVIYGILMLHDIDRKPALKQSIDEYDRAGMNLQKYRVKPIFKLDNFGPLPALSDISSASLDIRQQVFLSALGVSKEFLEIFPTELKFVASVIVYWVKNSSPHIKKVMVSCMMTCILYLPAKVFHQLSQHQKKSLFEKMTSESSLNLVKLMMDCKEKYFDLVVQNLGKMCDLPSTDYTKQIDIATVHSFNQFQSCLCYAIYLNSLLLKPFVATSPHLIFCGTFLYNLFHDVHQRLNPQKHIACAFGEDSVLGKLFVKMDEAFHSLLETC